ncbi:hypothetical protein [Nocardia spumae]|uniref:hypothetical protein n=1 Tax=Nocardia spumae TaxID=2887190 RepID=UPI0027E040B8|nr:hypothetical protein [Nocardia spumae]
MLRALSGTVAAGLVVLALVVVGAAIAASQRGFPGPGATSVGWHIALAVLALGAQIFSDRRRGIPAFFGSVVVFVAAGYLLVTQWWN